MVVYSSFHIIVLTLTIPLLGLIPNIKTHLYTDVKLLLNKSHQNIYLKIENLVKLWVVGFPLHFGLLGFRPERYREADGDYKNTSIKSVINKVEYSKK